MSDAERDALREVLVGAGSTTTPAVEPTVEPGEPGRPTEPAEPPEVVEPPEADAEETPPPAVKLNLDALRSDNSPPPEWVLCLDFGTAKSKAFAATDDEEDPELEPLPIGDDDGSVYEVSSCVWIDDDGRLYVGSEAVTRGMDYGDEPATRRPLDSLKQEISQVDPEDGAAELARKLPREVDPTTTLTYGDAITIYLAYLTDLATTAVERRVGTRYVRRRFTVPCWRSTQRRWAAELLGSSLLRAQLLADTFHDRWREGVPVDQVARAVRAATVHDDKLVRLAATEGDDATDWTFGTLEALAAASACVWRDRSDFSRDLMLVVDVGAGTTDLSLFCVVQDGGSHRAFPVVNGNSGVRQAGDTLDRLLVEALLRKAGLGGDDVAARARRPLRKRVRQMKERLFQLGGLTEELVNDEEVTLNQDEFIESKEVKRFADRIAGTIQELLEGVSESWQRAAAGQGVTLVLTGGGCDLPMITALKDRQWRLRGRVVRFRMAQRVPGSVRDRFDAPFIQVYPRLAVAMGGALKTRLDERKALADWPGGSPPPGRLERFAAKGV